MPKRKRGRVVPQTPRERLIPGNRRIKAPSGRSTWEKKAQIQVKAK